MRNDDFIILCRTAYFQGIRPAGTNVRETSLYIAIKTAAEAFFISRNHKTFSFFGMETRYLISLWMAHMLIEYGNVEGELYDLAIKIIKDHSESSMFPVVANEERVWLAERNIL